MDDDVEGVARGAEAEYNKVGKSKGNPGKIRNKKYPKLGKTEYVLVRRAQMSKYGSMEEVVPDIGYVYAYDMFYYIENYGPGEFRVIYRFNPATAQERIKFFREVIDNGYNEESYGSTPLYQSSARNGDNKQRGYNGNSDGVGNGRRIRKDERMDEGTDIENHADGHTEKSNGSKRNYRGIEKTSSDDVEYARADIRPDSPAQRWDAERIKNTERDEDKPPLSLSEIVAKIKHDFGIFGINITVGHVRGEGVRGEAAVFRECTIVMCFCVKI